MLLKSFLPAALLLLTTCLNELSAQVYTHTFACTADTYTSSIDPNNTNNAAIGILTQIHATVSPVTRQRAYYAFNLADLELPNGIPANAKIISASLHLYVGPAETAIPSFTIERVVNSWTESLSYIGENALSYASPLTNATPAVMLPSGTARTFNVTQHVQQMVSGMVVNNGWVIHHTQENVTSKPLFQYYSKEVGVLLPNMAYVVPTLEVKWYIPMSVSAASVTQASAVTVADGGVYPQLINGAGVLPAARTYKWFKSDGTEITNETSLSLTTAKPGWYGLQVADSLSDTLYMGFIVGLQCGSWSFDFNPGKKYISETVITNQYISATQTDNANANYANTLAFQATKWAVSDGPYNIKGLMRFHLWIDPSLSLDTAKLYLASRGHSITGTRLNTSNLVKIITPWMEQEATYNHAPATSTSISVEIPSTTTTLPVTSDILPFWNNWKNNNPANYGFMMRLADTMATAKANMNFHTTNVGNLAQWPYIRFAVTSNDCPTYSKLQPELDAAYHQTINNSLYFQYTEEYQEADGVLKYRVTNISTGALVTGLPDISGVKYGDNRLKLPASTLANGFYVLEVENQKGEVTKLRFKKI
jgi:hypothetical protein